MWLSMSSCSCCSITELSSPTLYPLFSANPSLFSANSSLFSANPSLFSANPSLFSVNLSLLTLTSYFSPPLILLHVGIDGKHILGVDHSVAVDIFQRTVFFACGVLHELIDGEHVLSVDNAVAVHVLTLVEVE